MDDDDDTRSSRNASTGGDAPRPGEKPGRGRPPKGKPTPVRLDPAEADFAMQLGAGVVAEGVRRALAIVSLLRPEQVESLMNKPPRFPLQSSLVESSAQRGGVGGETK